MARERRSSSEGFTLIELMVVVVIVGVLAAVAIPSFSGYVYRSRAAEATTFLAEIKQRQESYRAEFGQYCNVGMAYQPPGTPGSDPRAWPPDPGWSQLGASPDGLVRFQYRTWAGIPGEDPGAVYGFAATDFWFIAQAQGDLDGNGVMVMFEAYSFANHIYCEVNGAVCAKGWE